MSDIKVKIKKLLAKAAGTDNPHEHQAFYAAAHELMVKYNIAENELGGAEHGQVHGVERYADKKWIGMMMQAVAKLMSCGVIVDKVGHQWFGGRPTNVEMAEGVMAHYVAQLDRYYKLALPRGLTKIERSTFRRNFKEGAAQVVWQRVLEIVSANARALVVSPLQIEKDMEDLTGKSAGRSQSVTIKHNSIGTQAGRVAGHLVELGKEIKG